MYIKTVDYIPYINYSLIEDVFKNESYIRNSPYNVRMIFTKQKKYLEDNLDLFKLHVNECPFLQEMIERDLKYLIMVESVLNKL